MKSRFIMLGLVLALLLPLTALARPTGPVRTQPLAPNAPSVRISPSLTTVTGIPNSTVLVTYTVTNEGGSGDVQDSYAVTFPTLPAGWTANANPNPVANIVPGNSKNTDVLIGIPTGTLPGTYQIIVRVTAQGTGVTTSAQLNVVVVTPTPTSTPATPTTTPTSTIPAGTITATPNNVCNGAAGTRNDGFEPDNTKAEARRIEIDITLQAAIQHAMCPEGDEDWLFFGGLEGKVYTIDVPVAVPGLDLSITLYDANGNQLAFNDDYYLRNNDPTDINPRIQSWRAPANGQYYIKVRESAGRGFVNGFYNILLQSESYGPTPTLIPELCIDLYEPDGLPPLAPLMVVGEVHKIKRLCPTGDADWIKFFGAAGKSYSIFTTNATPNIGLDTVMVLTDRDGTSILDFNDDFGTSLDSRIDFAPTVDGFYYVQVKNVGDIGNQFAVYSLTFQVKSNANGGGGGGGNGGQPTAEPGQPTIDPGFPTTGPGLPTATLAGSGATATTASSGNTPTVTIATTPGFATQTAYAIGSDVKLPDFVTNSAGSFADPAFARVWERADAPIAGGVATRSWLWGPKSGTARAEVYDQAVGGLRQVQYFDKSRMEITNFNGDRGSQWFVTNGLLAKELIVGQVQLGDSSYIKRDPAGINIAGDLSDSQAPTYASFSRLLGPASDRSGQYADQTLSRSGKTGAYAGQQRDAAKLVTYVPQTRHNIASAFWSFMNRTGPVSEKGSVRDGQIMDWVFALGYPISEPYWARVKVNGVEQDVLVQAFERRVLTYTPSNPAEWQVEMGNVGQHYEQWRYR
jgi:hypothetical protein